MPRRVLLLNLSAVSWCCLLLALRFHLTGHYQYRFMLWNLFLALIPLGVSLGLARIRQLAVAAPLLGVWLLFFPNAPYVLTDLIHLNSHRASVPRWLDLVMLLSFALVSLWVGFQSLRLVQHWFTRHFSHSTGWCVVIGSLVLSGFGVYLGRFLRWNSWDIVRRPESLLKDIAKPFLDPLQHFHTWGFTLGFGTLLILGYLFWISALTTPHDTRNPG